MIVTVFRSRLRPGVEGEYLPMAMRMVELARAMPGFVSLKGFVAEDGEHMTLVEFESRETQEAWRRHAEHLVAQRRGRESFYSEYRITVCEVLRDARFQAERPADQTAEGPATMTAR